jgi:hypothetical protein
LKTAFFARTSTGSAGLFGEEVANSADMAPYFHAEVRLGVPVSRANGAPLILRYGGRGAKKIRASSATYRNC